MERSHLNKARSKVMRMFKGKALYLLGKIESMYAVMLSQCARHKQAYIEKRRAQILGLDLIITKDNIAAVTQARVQNPPTERYDVFEARSGDAQEAARRCVRQREQTLSGVEDVFDTILWVHKYYVCERFSKFFRSYHEVRRQERLAFQRRLTLNDEEFLQCNPSPISPAVLQEYEARRKKFVEQELAKIAYTLLDSQRKELRSLSEKFMSRL